jgi:hypothetical protein
VSGWGALTPTEMTVAGLVATGRSNPDIAADPGSGWRCTPTPPNLAPYNEGRSTSSATMPRLVLDMYRRAYGSSRWA